MEDNDLRKKYWIYPGVSVSHPSLPYVEIFVDELEREPKDESGRRKLIGVKCHWIYKGCLERGVFRTNELKPYKHGV